MAVSCLYLSSGQHFNVIPVGPIKQIQLGTAEGLVTLADK